MLSKNHFTKTRLAFLLALLLLSLTACENLVLEAGLEPAPTEAALESPAPVSPTPEALPTPTEEILAPSVPEEQSQLLKTAIGWYGSVSASAVGSAFDYTLRLLPEGTGIVGLIPGNPQVQAQIAAISDKAPPNQYANFWGTLDCPSTGGMCALMVTRLRPDGPGPLFPPDPVEGWQGTLITNPAWAQIDDAFVLSGGFHLQYGIWSEDPELAARLESFRNTGTLIQVWGQVTCGVIDANGCQIAVTRIENE